MARTATTPTKKSSTRATAQLPEKPSASVPARNVAALALITTGAHLAAYPWIGDTYTAEAAGVVGGAGLAAAVIHGARYARWRRVCEAQRVYERLCKVTGDPYAERKDRFKVNTWGGFEPHAATVRYGRNFPDDDPRAWAKLEAAFAAALRVPHAHVRSEGLRGGRARLALRADDERAHQAAHDAPDAPAGDAREVERALVLPRDEVTARVRDSLDALLEGCKVEVTDWHPDGAPKRLILTYPAKSTKAAREVRADLPTLMGDTYAPRTTSGHWHVEWQPEHARFILTDKPDLLAPLVALPEIESNLDLTAGPVLGVREDGTPWRLPLLGKHTIIAGQSGSGKGSVIWGTIRGIYNAIQEGRVVLWVGDPKGGMELGELEPFAHRFAIDDGGCIELLAEAVESMEAQARRLKAARLRKLEHPTRENPMHIILVDELASLTSLAEDSKTKTRVNGLTGKLLTKGRAVGFIVISALQDPKAKNLENRALYQQAVALSLRERNQTDMVLGAGARAEGAICDKIPDTLPGVGYVVADGAQGYARVRAAFVPDEELARLAGRQLDAPEHQAPTVGEQLALDAPATAEPVQVGEVLASMEVPEKPKPKKSRRNMPPPFEPTPKPTAAAEPVRIKDLGDDLDAERRWVLPQDEDPVAVLSIEPDEDDPDYRALVTYQYDGEAMKREASFEWTDTLTPA